MQLQTIADVSDYSAHALTKNRLYLLDDEYITIANLSGSVINRIKINRLKIDDHKIFDVENVYPIMYVTGNGDILFYDMGNKCFRMIYL